MKRYFWLVWAGFFLRGITLMQAEEAPLPGDGFAVSHYESLWTKSPFAVATPDAIQASPDYGLVGIAKFDGISYASIVNKQNQEHYLLSTNKPVNGISLISITKAENAAGTYAVIQKDGQSITVKLDTTAPAPPVAQVPGMPTLMPNVPANMQPPLPSGYILPGPSAANGSNLYTGQPPPVRVRRRLIQVPPPASGGQPAPQSAPTPPPP